MPKSTNAYPLVPSVHHRPMFQLGWAAPITSAVYAPCSGCLSGPSTSVSSCLAHTLVPAPRAFLLGDAAILVTPSCFASTSFKHSQCLNLISLHSLAFRSRSSETSAGSSKKIFLSPTSDWSSFLSYWIKQGPCSAKFDHRRAQPFLRHRYSLITWGFHSSARIALNLSSGSPSDSPSLTPSLSHV